MTGYTRTTMLVALIAFTCTSASAQTFPHAELGRQMLESHIRPTYRTLAASFAKLRATTQDVCADGAASSNELDRLNIAYRNAVLSWARASHLRFGPVTEQNRYERIVFWPDRKGRGRKQVRKHLRSGTEGLQPKLDSTMLSRKSVALQGLTALEIILYGTRANSKRVDKLGSFACSYAGAIGDNLEVIARDVSKSWDTNGTWSQRWLSAEQGNRIYLSQLEVTREFAHSFLQGMEELRSRHLIAPLGFVKQRLGRVYRPLFAASGLSTTYLRGGVTGLQHMFDVGGLGKALRQFDALQTSTVEWQFREALKAAKELDANPMGSLTQDPTREHAISMGFPMKSIMFHVSGLLKQHASLSLGFNASDGD